MAEAAVNPVNAEDVAQHGELFAVLFYSPRPSARIKPTLMVALVPSITEQDSNTFSLDLPLGTLSPGTSGASIIAFAPHRYSSYAASILGVQKDSLELRALHFTDMLDVIQIGALKRQAAEDAAAGRSSDCAQIAEELLHQKLVPLPDETVEPITPFLGDIVPMVQGGKVHQCMEKAVQRWTPELGKGQSGLLWCGEDDKEFCRFVDEDISRWRMKDVVKAKARVDRQNPPTTGKKEEKQQRQQEQNLKKGKKEPKQAKTGVEVHSHPSFLYIHVCVGACWA